MSKKSQITDAGNSLIASSEVDLSPQGIIAKTQALLQLLPDKTEEQIIDTGRNATILATCAYIIRGACATELCARTERQSGGRGNKDTLGKGRTNRLRALAGQMGVTLRTLQQDMRLYTVFFHLDQTCGVDATSLIGLSREHLRAAVSDPDPIGTATWAIAQMDTGGCTVQSVTDYVTGRRQSLQPALPSSPHVLAMDMASEADHDIDTLPSAPLTIINAIAPDPLDTLLGLQAVEQLRRLVDDHNAASGGTPMDAIGYLRHLIALAADKMTLSARKTASVTRRGNGSHDLFDGTGVDVRAT